MTRRFLIVIALIVLQGGFFVFTVNADDSQAVCRVRRSRIASRWVSYRETYTKRRWGLFKKKATRINYRWEHYLDWNDVNECCPGYQPERVQTSLCYPICRSGCVNGKCSRPNVCACNAGFRAVLTDGQSRCVPQCMHDGPDGCGFHGTCLAPNTCSCHNGYGMTITNINGKLTSGFPCIPICTPGCGKNSFCLSPNTCACNVGYIRMKTEKLNDHNITCEPSCVPKCGNNMNCFAPNKCQCDAGYISDTSGICSPVCNPPCIDGTCTRPGYCACNPGYKKMSPGLDHKCSPICDPPCVNATCTKPGYCECHGGYKKDPKGSAQQCLPVCDPPCINATCTKPGYCECHGGYKKDPKGSSQQCLPVCDPPCMNATCTEPSYCECHNGYKKDPKVSSQQCLPVCDPPCINATCIGPNHCECHDGYEKKLEGKPQLCSPVCNPGCNPNAFCDTPNKCICNSGYTVAITNSASVTTSNPLHAVGKSTLNFNEISCKPVCEPECKEHESCIAPNICQCDPGYRSDIVEANITRCLPICEPSCVNSYCGYPNKCICFSGYVSSVFENFVCDPVCQDGCFNASCTLPNHCECYDGYEKVSVPTESPEVQETYENTCVPSCPEKCLNGTCVAPGECYCDAGYVLKNTLSLETWNETITDSTENNVTFIQFCEPFCEPGCPNGSKCLSPNQCELQTDDTSNATHTINSIEDCGRNVNYLDENYKCVCKYGWTGWRCMIPSLCALIIRASSEDSEGSTTPQSIDLLSNDTTEATYDDISDMRMIPSDDESIALFDWEGPMCVEDCRILMTSSNVSGNKSDEAVNCYLLESENATTGVLSIRDQAVLPGRTNTTLVCFISIGSRCNLRPVNIIDEWTFEILIIIGAIASLVTLVGLTICCRKSKTVIDTSDSLMSNNTLLIRPESICSLEAKDQTSTL